MPSVMIVVSCPSTFKLHSQGDDVRIGVIDIAHSDFIRVDEVWDFVENRPCALVQPSMTSRLRFVLLRPCVWRIGIAFLADILGHSLELPDDFGWIDE